MNTANKLTLLRVILIPAFLVVLYLNFPYHQYVALGLFILASLTDLADGHIARKYHMITDFGKFMDPLADKLLVMAAMLWLVEGGRFPAWAMFLVVAREFAVTGLRLVAVEAGRVIAAGWSGKVKTAVTMVGICLMLLPVPSVVDQVVGGVIVVATVYSGAEYFIRNRDVLDTNNL